ncbi:MAG: nucleotidyltransferase substrate binding protein [Pseudobdellovibrio sp.]
MTSPKPAVREMAQSNLITDVQAWFDAIEARNKTSHSYDENIALEIISKVEPFINQADALLKELKAK